MKGQQLKITFLSLWRTCFDVSFLAHFAEQMVANGEDSEVQPRTASY